jgi:hypothetical protein
MWKLHLETLGGKYVIIDKLESEPQPSTDDDKNVIRKIEISTLISSNEELYACSLDLQNQAVLSLDIDRTHHNIKHK